MVDLGGVDKVSERLEQLFFNMGVNGAESQQVKGRGRQRKGRGHSGPAPINFPGDCTPVWCPSLACPTYGSESVDRLIISGTPIT